LHLYYSGVRRKRSDMEATARPTGIMDLAAKLVELDATAREIEREREKLVERLRPNLEAIGGRIRLSNATVYISRESRTRATLGRLTEILGAPVAKQTWAQLPQDVYESVRVTRYKRARA
jgi:hypothetical protein